MSMVAPAAGRERSIAVERLLGESGETAQVIEAARAMAIRALPILSDGLNAKLAAPLMVDLGGVEIGRMPQAKPADADLHAMVIAASSMSSDALVMVLDTDAVSVLVSALFGGDQSVPLARIERPFTPTELEVAALAFQEAAASLNGWGARSLDIKFPLPAVITGDELRRKPMRDGPAVRIVFSISLGDYLGRLTVMMPQRVLMHRTGTGPAATKAVSPEWRAQLNAEVMRSSVALTATIPLGRMALREISGLREGQVLPLGQNAQSDVRLAARDKTLFVCELGKLGQNYTVRVKNPFDAGRDLIDGIMSR